MLEGLLKKIFGDPNEKELKDLNRIVKMYLDYAEY